MIVLVMAAALSACGPRTQYWVKSGTGITTTAADLSACRIAANSGGQKVFSALEMESPCMVAKGYHLSPTPPSN
jgi:hypothetical protein